MTQISSLECNKPYLMWIGNRLVIINHTMTIQQYLRSRDKLEKKRGKERR